MEYVNEMQIIYEPTVRLIGVTAFRNSLDTEWDDPTSMLSKNYVHDSESLIEFAGRACYQSWKNPGKKSNREYIQHILSVGHLSVLEHTQATLSISGVSRSCTHELVRHRHLSFSQESQRYVDEGSTDFVIPPAFIGDEGLEDHFAIDCDSALCRYESYVNRMYARLADITDKTERRKKAREAARCILPNATATQIIVTGNYRAWRWFLKLRGSKHADAEIRRLAIVVHQVLIDLSPSCFNDFELGTGELTTAYPY